MPGLASALANCSMRRWLPYMAASKRRVISFPAKI
jgi:hypothetical protein